MDQCQLSVLDVEHFVSAFCDIGQESKEGLRWDMQNFLADSKYMSHKTEPSLVKAVHRPRATKILGAVVTLQA
jgi:hypothetical protein